jgi:hypothetical protein
MLKYDNTMSEIKNRNEPAASKIPAMLLCQIKTCNEEITKNPITIP